MANANQVESVVINIYVDNVWAGSGRLLGNADDGFEIVDCGAQFCDDNDESEDVYGMIEDAIDNGESSLTVDLTNGRKLITWSIG